MNISILATHNSEAARLFSDITRLATTEEELIAQDPEVIITTGRQDNIPLEKLTKVKWLQLSSAGADKLPDNMKKSDIIVTNASGVHPIPIAETVLGYMLIFARNLHIFIRHQKEKKWKEDYNLVFSELHGSNILVVGMGNIGRKIAQQAKAFGMNVMGIASKENVIDGVTCTPLNTLSDKVQDADFVVNVLPHTPTTHEVYDEKIFSRMKNSAVFVNIGRGKSVNENDLIQALNDGKIRGAALDVAYDEPLPKGSPLWEMENVIITPHISGSSPEYLHRLKEIFLNNLAEYKKENFPLPTQVDKRKGY